MTLNPRLHTTKELLDDAFADALDLQGMLGNSSITDMTNQLSAIHETFVIISNRNKRYSNLWKLSAGILYRWNIGVGNDERIADVMTLVNRLDK
jgi:hypothetical protein